MWGWLLLSWVGASVAFAVVHHRMRASQPQVGSSARALLARFEATLAREHPEVRFCGLVPGELVALLEVDGQETPVPLRAVLRHIEAFPDALPSLVDQLIAEVRELGLERASDYEFADVAADLMPQVRPLDWVAEKGRFGDSALVTRPLTDELCVAYVLDSEQCMTFVCRAHLRQWGRSAADVHNLALQNLRQRTGPVAPPTAGPLVFRTGDGYDAARMLLLDPDRCEGLLLSVPDRDAMWVGDEEDATVAQLMAQNDGLAAGHPISSTVLRVEQGQFVPLPGSEH